MQVFIGLGNPGEQYIKNRHNVGFLFVDALAQNLGEEQWQNKADFQAEFIKLSDFLIVKPQTFMNSSGVAARKIIDYFNVLPQYLYVIHDDLDIKLGEYKIQKGVGPKLHNGVNSIEDHLGTDQFWRIRIGVDNRNQENRIPGDVYSLQNFTAKELQIIYEVNKKIIKELAII